MFNFTTIAQNRKLRQSQRLNKFIKDLNGSAFETKKGKGFYANNFPPAIQNAINTAVERERRGQAAEMKSSQSEKCFFNIIVRDERKV